jgi:hypothetical protein
MTIGSKPETPPDTQIGSDGVRYPTGTQPTEDPGFYSPLFDLSDPSDADVLTYNSTTGKWEPQASAGGPGGPGGSGGSGGGVMPIVTSARTIVPNFTPGLDYGYNLVPATGDGNTIEMQVFRTSAYIWGPLPVWWTFDIDTLRIDMPSVAATAAAGDEASLYLYSVTDDGLPGVSLTGSTPIATFDAFSPGRRTFTGLDLDYATHFEGRSHIYLGIACDQTNAGQFIRIRCYSGPTLPSVLSPVSAAPRRNVLRCEPVELGTDLSAHSVSGANGAGLLTPNDLPVPIVFFRP